MTDAAEEAHFNSFSAVDTYQWLREVWSTRLLGIDVELGGKALSS